MFVYSDEYGEMWPYLLEKADAKLHGSYWHLDMALPMYAMVDFTGGFCESYFGPGDGGLEGIGMDLFVVCKLSDQRGQDPQVGQDQEPLGRFVGVEGTMDKSKEMKSLKKKQRNLVDVLH